MDSLDLIKLIKKAAVEAVNASKPANVVFGKVISTSPLQVQIDPKLILAKAQIVICERLNDLQADDKVILIQASGGQKYVVIDRIGGD